MRALQPPGEEADPAVLGWARPAAEGAWAHPLPGDTNAELQLPPHWGLASCVPDVQRQVSGGLEEAWDSELS